ARGDEVLGRLLRVLERRAPGREPRDEFLQLGVVLPRLADRIDRWAGPHCGDRELRHLRLRARPVGVARTGAVGRAPGGAGRDRRGCEDRVAHHASLHAAPHVSPPGPPRRAMKPRDGSYAMIAPTMNTARQPSTTASEIQLILA